MKNETIKIGLVKEWGSPRSNIQLFMPQEYCSNCWESIASIVGPSTTGYYKFLDITGKGNCDQNDRISNNTDFIPSPGYVADNEYLDVTLYVLYHDGTLQTRSYSRMPANAYNHSYSSSFSYDGDTWSFVSIAHFEEVKVNKKHVSYKVHEAS